MKKKSIVASLVSIAVCSSIVAGSTYALFTSESDTNVAITSGNVEVVATLDNLAVHSPTLIATDGTIIDNTNAAQGLTFANGGFADIAEGTLTLSKMTPGDKATFNIDLENKSDVAIQWQTAFETNNDTGLFDGLVVKIDDETFGGVKTSSDWTFVAAGEAITPDTIEVSVELPTTAGNTYMGKSCDIYFAINAIQSNAAPVNADLTTLQGEEAKDLEGTLYLGALNADLTTENPDIAIGDENFQQSSVTKIVFTDGVINTPYKTARTDVTNELGHANNEYNGSRIFLGRVPDGAKVVFNNVTINGWYNFTAYYMTNPSGNISLEFVNCTFNGCWSGETNNFASITFEGCRFTLRGTETVDVKNTNPVWFLTGGNCPLTFDGCVIEGNRPIKYEYNGDIKTNPPTVFETLNVKNCTFKMTMSDWDLAKIATDGFDKVYSRLTAVRFNEGVGTTNITGNTLVSGYAFYQTNNAPYSNADYNDAANKNTIPEGAKWVEEY